MNYRLATMLAKASKSADFTEIIDINLADPISQIVILYKSKSQGFSGGTTTYDMPVAALTKIEIVDGSDVLFSLSGKDAQALDFYHNKIETLSETRFMNDGWSHSVVNINFGRFLYDPLLAFDPKRFTNPQLKITCDISAGCCDSDDARLTVMAHVFHDKAVDPVGFLVAKELKSYNLVSAGHEYTELPTDLVYRKLLIRALRHGTQFSSQITRIKISEDNDRSVIIDDLADELLTSLIQLTPPYREVTRSSGCTTTAYGWTTATQRVGIVAVPWEVPHTSDKEVSVYTVGGGRFQFDQGLVSNIVFKSEGWLPHGVFELPFGLQNEIEDWYDVTKVGSLVADITGGQSTGTCALLLQQLRKYAA